MNGTSNITNSSAWPPSGEEAEEPIWSQIFRVIAFSVITLASLFGNIVICKTACEFPARKPLSYRMVTNLAVAEIISTLCLPFAFVYSYMDKWPFGAFLCSLVIPLQATAMFVVTNTLAAIAVYRFVFIVFQPSRRIVTDCKMILLLCLLWVVALAIILPLFMFHKIILYENKTHCGTVFPGDDSGKSQESYKIAKFVLNFGLPYLIMVVSYGAVALKLRKHIKRSKEEEALEMAEVGQTVLTIDHEIDVKRPSMTTQDRKDTADRMQRRRSTRDVVELEYDLLRMIYAVIIVFVLCYLPYQIYFLFVSFGGLKTFPEVGPYIVYIFHYSFLLTSLPSALHPLFYGTMNKFYARSFSRLVLCRK